MSQKSYLVATLRPWNIKRYHDTISRYPGRWFLITKPEQLTIKKIRAIRPRYIFFPHWGSIVPSEILKSAECVCFHETDLPYGRGGSPIQNLIVRGHRKTMLSALRMTEKLDAGPIYAKKRLSLEGRAEEIFERASQVMARMIGEIIRTEPTPKPQKGRPMIFKRRKPAQSLLTDAGDSLSRLYDYIRMLDAPEYPKAFLDMGKFRLEFDHARLGKNELEARVTIKNRKGKV